MTIAQRPDEKAETMTTQGLQQAIVQKAEDCYGYVRHIERIAEGEDPNKFESRDWLLGAHAALTGATVAFEAFEREQPDMEAAS